MKEVEPTITQVLIQAVIIIRTLIHTIVTLSTKLSSY